ncbi:MAG: hypothetical protein F6K24_57745 [Okeania sp. SIO2D1]|nr:hypothetical protein [Okeania sp. SIO2D1]
MRQSLLRFSLTLGVIGTTLIGSVLGSNFPAQALPEEEVVKTLEGVPVFMITDLEGRPVPLSLSLGGQNVEKKDLAVFFISEDNAEEVVEKLESQSSQLEGKVEARALPLSQAYQLMMANQELEDSPFLFFPERSQVQEAVKILRQENSQVQGFNAVPLFVAKQVIKTGDQEEEKYLTFQQGDREVIPVFFDIKQLEESIKASQAENPELSSSAIAIDVISLEDMINLLHSSDNEQLKNLVFMPLK